MAEEPLYIGVENQATVRKDILLCSREVITSLKNYEVYKNISRQAVETTFELRRVMEELVVLNRKLRQALPKTKLKAKAGERKIEKKAAKPTISKIRDLEKSLDVIEHKLKKMK